MNKNVIPVGAGATLGFMGGGQLARMSAVAARRLGYRVVVLDPDAHCAAAAVVDDVIRAEFDDVDAATKLAQSVDVVSWEIEKIGLHAAKAASAIKPLRPGCGLLEMVQNKARQKEWLAGHNFLVGAFCRLSSDGDIDQVAKQFAGPVRIKACFGGYDGRSQTRVSDPSDQGAIKKAWQQLGGLESIVEAEVNLQAEMSVLVARNAAGDVQTHPASHNWHKDAILDVCLMPADLPDKWTNEARGIAKRLADELKLEGILVVEFFVDDQEQVLINELAPRPHNTYHTTMTACQTDQFEQYVRAICNLPLGATDVIIPTALGNLLGDEWLNGPPAKLDQVMAMPEVQIHLYGKEPRPKRKIGHLLARSSDPQVALKKAREALALIQTAL